MNAFDRLVFRGTLRPIVYPYGMMAHLREEHVLLKDLQICSDSEQSIEKGFYKRSVMQSEWATDVMIPILSFF
jgi:hypothetical protein